MTVISMLSPFQVGSILFWIFWCWGFPGLCRSSAQVTACIVAILDHFVLQCEEKDAMEEPHALSTGKRGSKAARLRTANQFYKSRERERVMVFCRKKPYGFVSSTFWSKKTFATTFRMIPWRSPLSLAVRACAMCLG